MPERQNIVGYTESKDYRCLEDLQEAGVITINNQLHLDYCGAERCQPGHSFGPYIRENYVIHIITKGTGTLSVEGRTWQLHENQAFLLKPGTEGFYQADMTDPWTYYWVGFHGPRSEKLISGMGFAPQKDVIDLKDAESLTGYIDGMLDNRALTYAGYLKRSGFFALLLADMVEEAAVPEQPGRPNEETYVDMAMAEIEGNYNRTVTISRIAARIGINRSYLSIIFKKHTGMSPQEYLIDYRMRMAASLLQETDLAVRAVASSVGYADPLTFTKAFKKRYGVSPSTHREAAPTLLRKAEKGEYQGKLSL